MKYQYYIVSAPNDFYMADAICRELEMTGASCYFNLRDSKKAEQKPDAYDNIGNETSIIAIGNDEFISNSGYTSPISFYSKKTSPERVFIIQNGRITEYPNNWSAFRLLDATKGLNRSLISVIKGEIVNDNANTKKVELSAPISPTPQTRVNAETEQHNDSINVNNEQSCYRVEKPSIDELIVMEDGLSLTLQRAIRYLMGEDVPQDDERAYSLFKKAVTENPDDYKAQYYFGVCSELEYGGGKKEDAKFAYEKAVELGNDDISKQTASIRLAMIEYEEKEYKEARELFTKMSTLDPITSSYGLGLIDEAETKYDDAVEHYSEAAELGNLPAQNALGCLYAEGKGVTQNDNKALQWFVMAANKGLTEAMVNAGIRLVEYADDEFRASGEAMLQEAANRGNQIARLRMLDIEEKRIAEEKKLELERKRQEQSRSRRDDDDSNDSNSGESAWGAFLEGLDLPGLAGYAKDRLWS